MLPDVQQASILLLQHLTRQHIFLDRKIFASGSWYEGCGNSAGYRGSLLIAESRYSGYAKGLKFKGRVFCNQVLALSGNPAVVVTSNH